MRLMRVFAASDSKALSGRIDAGGSSERATGDERHPTITASSIEIANLGVISIQRNTKYPTYENEWTSREDQPASSAEPNQKWPESPSAAFGRNQENGTTKHAHQAKVNHEWRY
jgi:hypothetical protein